MLDAQATHFAILEAKLGSRLALLLIRVVENATGESWRCVRDELERMHLVTLQTAEGRVAKRSLTSPGQRRIFAALELPEPPAFSDFEASSAPA